MRLDTIEPIYVDTMPSKEDMEEGKLYISKKYRIAIHLCACGCCIETVTPLEDKTGWNMFTMDGKVTLTPSIGNQQFPCRSHYWIQDNKIVWC